MSIDEGDFAICCRVGVKRTLARRGVLIENVSLAPSSVAGMTAYVVLTSECQCRIDSSFQPDAMIAFVVVLWLSTSQITGRNHAQNSCHETRRMLVDPGSVMHEQFFRILLSADGAWEVNATAIL